MDSETNRQKKKEFTRTWKRRWRWRCGRHIASVDDVRDVPLRFVQRIAKVRRGVPNLIKTHPRMRCERLDVVVVAQRAGAVKSRTSACASRGSVARREHARRVDDCYFPRRSQHRHAAFQELELAARLGISVGSGHAEGTASRVGAVAEGFLPPLHECVRGVAVRSVGTIEEHALDVRLVGSLADDPVHKVVARSRDRQVPGRITVLVAPFDPARKAFLVVHKPLRVVLDRLMQLAELPPCRVYVSIHVHSLWERPAWDSCAPVAKLAQRVELTLLLARHRARAVHALLPAPAGHLMLRDEALIALGVRPILASSRAPPRRKAFEAAVLPRPPSIVAFEPGQRCTWRARVVAHTAMIPSAVRTDKQPVKVGV